MADYSGDETVPAEQDLAQVDGTAGTTDSSQTTTGSGGYGPAAAPAAVKAGRDEKQRPAESNSVVAEEEIDETNPAAYIDWGKGQSSRTKDPRQAVTEAGVLIQNGWRPKGPYEMKSRPGKFMFYMEAPNGKGRVHYLHGKNIDERVVGTIKAFYAKKHPEAKGETGASGSTTTSKNVSPDAQPPAGAGSGSGTGSGRPPGRPPSSSGKPEDDPNHPLYPYLGKEDRAKSVVFEILKGAKEYQAITYDLGWQALVTILQVAKLPAGELKARLLDYKAHPENFKAFLLDQLESLLMTATDNGYGQIEDLKERNRVERTKVQIATGKMLEMRDDMERMQAETDHYRRTFNIAIAMMDDDQVRRLANALAVYDTVVPDGGAAQGQEYIQQVPEGRWGGGGGHVYQPQQQGGDRGMPAKAFSDTAMGVRRQ